MLRTRWKNKLLKNPRARSSQICFALAPTVATSGTPYTLYTFFLPPNKLLSFILAGKNCKETEQKRRKEKEEGAGAQMGRRGGELIQVIQVIQVIQACVHPRKVTEMHILRPRTQCIQS